MKREILETMKKNKGAFISGEELSQKIGVTRTAVWKHMKQLKEEGYEVESVSRKGYRLIKEPDTLDKNAIEIEMGTHRIGSRIFHFESIDSTNNMAKKLASEGEKEGSVIISEEQTGGRGRLGRQWVSPKSTGVWMSIILRPDIDPSEAAKITQITAAAVATAIRKSTGCEAGIKWPNDIILNNKKICGILTEMSAELNFVNYIVVGIGINVNVDIEEFPEDIRQIATSMKDCVGKIVLRKELVIEILKEFENLYDDFIQKKSMERSVEICKKYSVTLGRRVKILNKDKTILAEAIDLTDEGELLIKGDDGGVQKIISGEVSVRGISDYV